MENENTQKNNDDLDFIKMIREVEKNSQVYNNLALVLQGYMDGLKAMSRCLHFAQTQSK